MSPYQLRYSTLLKAHFKNGFGFILIIFFQLLSQQASSQGKYVWADLLEGNNNLVYHINPTSDNGSFFSGYYPSSIEFGNGVKLTAQSIPFHIKNFLAKKDSSNRIEWIAKQGGRSGNLHYFNSEVDKADAIYTAGMGRGRAYLYDTTGKNTKNISLTSSYLNGFVFKYSSDGAPLWGISVTSQYSNVFFDKICLDDSANVYSVVGTSGTGPVHISGYNNRYGVDRLGGRDVLLMKYDSSGTYQWHRVLGTKKDDMFDFMLTDQNGYSYLQMTFGLSTKIDSVNLLAKKYLLKFNRNGKLLWARDPIVHGTNIKLEDHGRFYVAGEFKGTGPFPNVKFGNARSHSPYFACYDTLGKLIWAKGYANTISKNANAYFAHIDYGSNTGLLHASGQCRDTIDFGIGKVAPYSIGHLQIDPKNGNIVTLDTLISGAEWVQTYLGKEDQLHCVFRLQGTSSGSGDIRLGKYAFKAAGKYTKEMVLAEYEFPCSGKNYRLQSPAFACNNDSITLRANGGHIVSWYSDTTRIDSGNSSTRVLFSNQASIKAVFYDTVANCVVSKFMETKPFPSPIVKFDTIPVSCANADSFGLKVTNSFTGVLDSFYGVGVTGNYFYPTQANVGSNLVYHHFKDSNSCVTTTSANMVVLGLPPINGGADTMVCDGDSAKLTANGANVYEWNWLSNTSKTSSISFLPLSKTLVLVKGTDTNGCSDIDTVTVSVRQLPTVYAGKDTSVCEGKSIQLTAIGAQQYTWMGSSKGANYTVSPTSTSTYYVRGVDSASCLNTDTVLVTLHKNPVLNIGKDTAVCPGATVVFTGKGANTYQWYPMNTSGNTASLVVNANTTVTVVGASLQGCIDSTKRKITLLTTKRVDAGLGDTICLGASAMLTANGAATYHWPQYNSNNSQVTVSPNKTGYIFVEGTSSNCTTADSVLVVVNPLPNLAISGDSTLCLTESTNLTVSGAKTYQWSNGLGSSDVVTVSPPFTSNYSVTGIDVNGCQSTATRKVTVNPIPPVQASNDQVVCENTLVLISATGALTYNWSDGLGSGSSHSFSAKQSETYAVEGTDGNGCTNVDSVMITVNPLPVVTISGSAGPYFSDDSDRYTLTGNPTGGEFIGPGMSGQFFIPKDAGIGMNEIIYLYTDNNDCVGSDTLRIEVKKSSSIQETVGGQISLYPNPNNGEFTLIYSENLDVSKVALFGIDGKEWTISIERRSQGVLVTTEAKPGIYFLKVFTVDAVFSMPITIQ